MMFGLIQPMILKSMELPLYFAKERMTMESEQWNTLGLIFGCIAIIVVITYFAVKIGQINNDDDWPAY